ncbi:MAG: GDSL-type esterase/lipase family protein [Candidatus Limivicinus sp.]
MKEKKPHKLLREICLGIGILLLCFVLLLSAVMNYQTLQMDLKSLPYSIQGYPQGQVLLIGSSFMEYWKTSEADLGPLHTVNVGVGGTRVSHWKENIYTLIEPFHPRAIVVYVGSNDIDGSTKSKTGEAVAAELEEFFDLIQEAIPGTPVYYISIAPTPKRWNVWEDSNRCNELVAQLARERENLTFLDCTDVLLDENGQPIQEIFKSDDLHFNDQGYELWKSVIRPVLLEALGEGESMK